MDATITNTTSEAVFLSGPKVSLGAGESMTWSDITLADLDGDDSIKSRVLTGDLTVALSTDAADAALLGISVAALPKFAFASLPAGFEGQMAFVTDGRKVGETGGNGTGVPAYFSNAVWRSFITDVAVTI